MSNLINWIRNPIWILSGQVVSSEITQLDDFAGNYHIQTGDVGLSQSKKEHIILKFHPYRAFRADFSEMAEDYKEEGDAEYWSKFICHDCKVNNSYDDEDRSGFESNDWTKIVTQIASHLDHEWTFFAEIENNNEEVKYIISMSGSVA
jgi:hypothetical protein